MVSLNYFAGFGNHHSSEAIKGALPIGQNTPQKCPHGLYAEQLSGTAFTMSRHQNQRRHLHSNYSWLYRIRPSACHRPFKKVENEASIQGSASSTTPNQLRWNPVEIASTPHDFCQGLKIFCGAGDASLRHGLNILVYTANRNMERKAFSNSDGDLLIGTKS
jgi:homogentisate 1,2-dioxygenase